MFLAATSLLLTLLGVVFIERRLYQIVVELRAIARSRNGEE
ncbi:MAG: hypothetical protein R3F34_20485 [Planctomycetota bacterium]